MGPFPRCSCPCRLQVLWDSTGVRTKHSSSIHSSAAAPTPCLLPGSRPTHTLQKWWEIASTLLPHPPSVSVMYTKAAFLSFAHGRVPAEEAHVAREKALGCGPGKFWTGVICLENISPQSDVCRTWAWDTFSVGEINSFEAQNIQDFPWLQPLPVLAYLVLLGLNPVFFRKQKLEGGNVKNNENI